MSTGNGTMTAMDKAKAAMAAAKELLDGAELVDGLLSVTVAADFNRLMRVAQVQTLMALAESVERLSAKLGS